MHPGFFVKSIMKGGEYTFGEFAKEIGFRVGPVIWHTKKRPLALEAAGVRL